MNRLWSKVAWSVTLLIMMMPFSVPAAAQETAIISQKDIFHPVIGRNGMVATQQQYATDAGLQVLKEGGNTIDAAVTIGFTLAVTLPRAGNIGGGGFMLIHSVNSGETVALNYREKAPMSATRDMFLDENGDADPENPVTVIWPPVFPGPSRA